MMTPVYMGQGSRRPSAASQRGQALVLSLFVVGVIILAMVALYSMGQQTIAKIKLQNTADAAAYSAAVAQARDYNFAAYTNRAMVANQVAVAQVVGLTSWARNYGNTYNGKFSALPQTLVNLTAPPSILTYFWTIPWTFHRNAGNLFKRALDTAAPPLALALDGLIDVLGTSQQFYHYGTGLTVAQILGLNIFGSGGLLDSLHILGDTDNPIMTSLRDGEDGYNVIKLNDRDAGLSVLGKAAVLFGLVQWFGFTENKNPNAAAGDGQDAGRFAKVTVESLDGFSRNRSSPFGMYLPPAPFLVDPTRFYPMQSGPFLMWLWHKGGTELKDVGKQKLTWSAMDATGFTGLAFFWIPPIPPFLPFPIPILIPAVFMPLGWGGAQAGQAGDLSPANNFDRKLTEAYGGAYGNANTAAAAAVARTEGAGEPLAKVPSSGGGLRKYFDVKAVTDNTKPNLEAPPLVIEIEKDAGRIPNSNSHFSGRFTLVSGTQSGSMRALSKAQAHFSRPLDLFPRGDDAKTELGSLYNPYWQARLVANNTVERYFSMYYHLH